MPPVLNTTFEVHILMIYIFMGLLQGGRLMMRIGLIGGSGLEGLFGGVGYKTVSTPYGDIKYLYKVYDDVGVIFIPRHGPRHEYPPHRVNYRGNIYALAKLGVDRVIATSAVGSIDESLHPGSIVLVDQFIDYTKRSITFYDDYVVHVDVTNPYCRELSRTLYNVGKKLGLNIRWGAVYICTEGPRFETPAEINMFRLLGANVVGMTNVPEVVLAREAGLHYSLVSIITNYAAGMQERVSQEEVLEIMERTSESLKRLIHESIEALPRDEWSDECIRFRDVFRKYVLGVV